MLTRSLLVISVALMSVQAFAYDGKTCHAKKQRIEQQIRVARSHHDVKRVRGLERSLAQVNRQCNNHYGHR